MSALNLSMFVVIGAVLATAGIGVTDWQFYATLIAANVAANT